MKGLLKKELYMAWRYCKMFLVIIAVFIGMAFAANNEEVNFFWIIYPFLLVGMIPMTTMAYDERQSWPAYSATLPCSRGQTVSAKYLSGLLYVLGVVVLYMAVYAVRAFINAGSLYGFGSFVIGVGAMCLTAGLAGATLCLPFCFALGVEKGRIAYYITIFLVCAGGPQLLMKQRSMVSPVPFLSKAPIAFLAVAALYVLSWQLSVFFYKKREL